MAKLWFGNQIMESEQVVKKNKSTWRVLLTGFLLGVLASFLVLVVIAFKYGSCSYSNSVDLYSGHRITNKSFLWKHSQISRPNEPHVQWAIEHLNPVRKWYLPNSSFRRGWFEKGLFADYTTREYVYSIYSLQIPKEEKIKLLHQYHKELDALKLKEQEIRKSFDYLESFFKDWEQKLEKIKNDATGSSP